MSSTIYRIYGTGFSMLHLQREEYNGKGRFNYKYYDANIKDINVKLPTFNHEMLQKRSIDVTNLVNDNILNLLENNPLLGIELLIKLYNETHI